MAPLARTAVTLAGQLSARPCHAGDRMTRDAASAAIRPPAIPLVPYAAIFIFCFLPSAGSGGRSPLAQQAIN